MTAEAAVINLRSLAEGDQELLFAWRNDPWIVERSTSRRLVSWPEHRAWCGEVLSSPLHLAFVITIDGEEAGLVRFHRTDPDQAEVSIYLIERFTGRGWGVAVLRRACALAFAEWPIRSVRAHVRSDNAPSCSAFTRAGFTSAVALGKDCPPSHKEFLLEREEEKSNPTGQDLHMERLRSFYLPLLGTGEDTYRTVGWGSQRGQTRRFEVLLEVGQIGNGSVLDVGCGIGHLADHLQQLGYKGDYLGIDLVSEMVATASSRCPGWSFRVADLAAPDSALRRDFVFGSGLFTFADEGLMCETIARMYSLCQVAVAVNSLSSWAASQESGEFHADPAKVLAFCSRLTSRVVLRHDYMPHDFTIYLYRGKGS
ncbi:MAG: bifunctional GNAT family N-acetyltransferase/class I SAM-dependent methyltransferase [Desulfobacteraceae bacterium]|nr:bifunctional GNAT family N-acetyltransferase/class I SAM-dependent methyltransferase [Desulfobacteraceae bacterium]